MHRVQNHRSAVISDVSNYTNVYEFAIQVLLSIHKQQS